ncbi:hypothetical protein BH10PLA2_BH10PLA2_33450 [soil metagenome]
MLKFSLTLLPFPIAAMFKVLLILSLPFAISNSTGNPAPNQVDEPQNSGRSPYLRVGPETVEYARQESVPKKAVQKSELRLELMDQQVEATVGVPVSIMIRVTNTGRRPCGGVLLSACFDKELQHETRANPVELPLAVIPRGERKNLPLILTPTSSGVFFTKVTLTANGEERHTSTEKISVSEQVIAKSPRPSGVEMPSIPPPILGSAVLPAYSANLWNARSHVFTFVHAQAEGRSVKVSDLRMEYVQRSYPVTTPEGKSSNGSYYEGVTKESDRSIPATKIRAMRADAKRLSSAELLKALKEPMSVVLFREGETLDPFVLSLFKSETLILVLPGDGKSPESSPSVHPMPACEPADVSSK